MRLSALFVAVSIVVAADGQGQTPQPFPRPGDAGQTQRPATPPAQPQRPAPAPTPAQAPTAAPAPQPAGAKPQSPSDPNAPSVYFPVYPSAQMLGSYDAGRGQRYYVFGTTATFVDTVNYYRTQLDEKGTLVFKEPPTHMFEVGRFREESMAFPPGVTVKDWTWGGSQGYPNPKLGGQPGRFPTVIMIVPPPALTPQNQR